MPPLLPGFGVPDGPLSFDHLMVTWMLILPALVLLLALALRIVPRHGPSTARRPPTPVAAAPRIRPKRRHLRAVA